MIVFFAINAPGTFLSRANFLNILSQASLTAIISAGLTFTLVVGEFDLSIGNVASFIGLVVAGLMAKERLPIPVSVALALLVGDRHRPRQRLSRHQGQDQRRHRNDRRGHDADRNRIFLQRLSDRDRHSARLHRDLAGTRVVRRAESGVRHGGAAHRHVDILNKTDLGQRMQAVGSNIEAARLSGIRVDRMKMFAFATAGFCAALTGVLLTSLLGSGTLAAADGYLLDAFAAVFLGSATLREGQFHILGTLIGVLILAVGFNGLSIFGAPTYFQPIFKGGVLVLAVGLSSLARRYASAS